MEYNNLFKNAITMHIPNNFTNIFNTPVDVIEEKDDIIIKPRTVNSGKLRHILGSPEKFKSIFIGHNPLEYRFNKFFKFEVIKLLETAINGRGAKVGIDIAKTKQILSILNPNIDYDNLPDIDRGHIEDVFDFKILPHQEEAIKKYMEFKHIFGYRGMLLHGSIGVGKSLTVTYIMEGLHKEIDKVIIICPLNTVNKVWESTLSGNPNTGFKKSQSQITLARTTKYQDEKYIICHYEALEKLLTILPNIQGRIGIIIDESHNLNDPKSKRTQLALEIIEKTNSNNVILMSGTPVKSGFKELSIIFKFLDKRFTNDIERRFIQLYKSTNSFLREVLKERYNGYTTVITKDVLNLEPITTVNLKIDLPKEELEKFYLNNIKEELRIFIEKRFKELEEQKEYWENEYFRLLEKARSENKKLQSTVIYNDYLKKVNIIHSRNTYFDINDLITEVNKFEKNEILPYLQGIDKKQFKEAKTIYKYPMFKIQGEALANVIGKARIECHKQLANALEYPTIINSTEKKTIIFSNYIDVCNTAKEKVLKYKYQPALVYGETVKDLSKTVQSFTNNKHINPLITTYKSLSTGVPLIAADTIICVDLPFRMYIYEQAIGRAWRLGQDKPVVVYILELNTDVPNINSRNIDIIQFFKEEVEKITGIPTSIELIRDNSVVLENEFSLETEGLKEILITSKHYFIKLLDKIIELWEKIYHTIKKFFIDYKKILEGCEDRLKKSKYGLDHLQSYNINRQLIVQNSKITFGINKNYKELIQKDIKEYTKHLLNVLDICKYNITHDERLELPKYNGYLLINNSQKFTIENNQLTLSPITFNKEDLDIVIENIVEWKNTHEFINGIKNIEEVLDNLNNVRDFISKLKSETKVLIKDSELNSEDKDKVELIKLYGIIIPNHVLASYSNIVKETTYLTQGIIKATPADALDLFAALPGKMI